MRIFSVTRATDWHQSFTGRVTPRWQRNESAAIGKRDVEVFQDLDHPESELCVAHRSFALLRGLNEVQALLLQRLSLINTWNMDVAMVIDGPPLLSC
jgi:hypothetical protein